MFPTTIWTTIRQAGHDDGEALERFARQYRAPVLGFINGQGMRDGDAEDLCQEVFLRLLNGNVLARADAARGRFRSLLLTITKNVITDKRRKRQEAPAEDIELSDRDPDFDREWVVELVERAMSNLSRESPGYHEVLREHLAGRHPNRNKLWIARRKLIGLIRGDVARTCASRSQFEDEIAYLSQFLRPLKKI